MVKIVNISVKNENIEWWKKFDEMRWRERKSLSQLVQEACQEYYQRHAEVQNPQNTLDLHIKHPTSLAMPAIVSENLNSFKEFMNSLDDKNAERLMLDLQSFTGSAEKRVKYGDAKMKVVG